MSNIGKKIINIPNNIKILLKKNIIIILGKYGILKQKIINLINITILNNNIYININNNNNKKLKSYYGLIRSLIQNMIIGVNKKFSIVLNIEGIGNKFQINNNFLIVYVGFSHPIYILISSEFDVKLESNKKIIISCINKQKLGLFASKIRSIKPREPYKGSGIFYEKENFIKKICKKTKKNDKNIEKNKK